MKLDNFISQAIGWGLIFSAIHFVYLSVTQTMEHYIYGALYIFCYATAGVIFSIRHLKNKE